MERLPDDMLADVLGRLPPSSLAASRCVRKRWRSLIDARRLLRADLLPLRLDAFYCISHGVEIDRVSNLFARPAAARRIPGGCLDFLGEDYSALSALLGVEVSCNGKDYSAMSALLEVEDSCNGLLLLYNVVVNPATRQWASLPDYSEPSIGDMLGVRVSAGTTTTAAAQDQETNDDHLWLDSRFYLVYDPMAESPQHFEVFIVPLLARHPGRIRENIPIDLEEQEWPPSTFKTHVFSSRRWRWEERSWIRQGEPAGTMADMLLQSNCGDRKAIYFRGALYVHCQNDSVMRIALSNDKYQMVRSPATLSKLGAKWATFYLEKSEKGVYFALLYRVDCDSPRFQVWLLKEEEEENDDRHHHIHMEWVLKTNISLEPLLAKPPLLHCSSADDEWRIIRDYNDEEELPPAAAHGDDVFVADDEWDFDNADVILDEAKENKAAQADRSYSIEFLGFHPYKEIVFFSLSSRTISYNLNTSKVQRLGGNAHVVMGIKTCFPYTPCLLTMGELFESS